MNSDLLNDLIEFKAWYQHRLELHSYLPISVYLYLPITTLRNEWKLVLDVNEFAYYVGPTDGLDMHGVDVNDDYSSPELTITMSNSIQKGAGDE